MNLVSVGLNLEFANLAAKELYVIDVVSAMGAFVGSALEFWRQFMRKRGSELT